MPVAFIGHGSPMNTLENNNFTAAWCQFGTLFANAEHNRAMNDLGIYATPKAILCVSAHWAPPGGATLVQTSDQPTMIHDYSGFPPELSRFRYPVAGAPGVALRVADLLRPMCAPAPIGRTTTWGVDHGTWSVLAHVFPDANVPVTQLSIDLTRPAAWHLEAGRKLAVLRQEGVLIIGTGNIVHNLGAIDWSVDAQAHPAAIRFHDHIVDAIERDDTAAIERWHEHPDAAYAAPTPEHFLPLLYVLGARAKGERAKTITDGYVYSSLSMYSVRFG
jgi:4,5-DOPA dioxygenase extradiol